MKNLFGGWSSTTGETSGETNPHPCEGLGDRTVCCSVTGATGTCTDLYGNCGGTIVSTEDDRCPKS
ncbi:hypothetical protein [Sphingobacterium alimentarium]|uniref:hypothetical protein n=1 Tax=Sphingobacterium alimentarium TaxID=797292 RepID=UPI001046DC89|nr:hypothetical protein [Sphingobacterium alimentarium]